MRYRRRKVDANQAEIVEALRGVGCSVVDLSAVGGGAPDLLVGRDGRNWLIECKNPNRRKEKFSGSRLATEERQAKFRSEWRGQVAVAFTPDEALRALKAEREGR